MKRGQGGRTWSALGAAVIVCGCAAPEQPPAATAETAETAPPDPNLLLFMMAVDDEDHSADGWSVPEGLEVRDPESNGASQAEIQDPFLDALLAGAASTSGGPATLDTRMTGLAAIATDLAEVERRLARSPAWRIYEERGQRIAVRMLPSFGRYQVTLHGFFYDHDLSYSTSRPEFGFRLRLILGAAPSDRVHSVRVPVGAAVSVPLDPGTEWGQRGIPISHIGIQHGSVLVEVFEESRASDRALTRAALAEVERALSLDTADPSPDPNTVPTEPDFSLRNGMQGGMYELEAWVNPGEPGTLEVRAFEVTTNTPLSQDRIAQSSRVRVQGTANGPLLPARAEFKIYEGDWGHYYAARIELWFTPDLGRPRKLLERVYRVEGWMR